MESFKQQENELFKVWKESLPNNLKFVPDGIVSEKDDFFIENKKRYEYTGWNNAHCKILFLLKETYDVKANNETDEEYLKNSWDLRDFIYRGTIKAGKSERENKKTFANISRWTYGIKEFVKTGIVPEWTDAKLRGNKVGRLKHLKSICAVNLNKQPGGASSKDKKIKEYFVNHNRSFLIEQLALYADTDIIICCGDIVKQLFVTMIKEIYDEKLNHQQENIVDGIWTYRISNGPLIIGFYHPQQRTKNVSNEILYNKLTNAIKANLVS